VGDHYTVLTAVWITAGKNYYILYGMTRQSENSNEEIEKIFVPHKYDMRSWYMTFACIFLVVGSYLFITQQSFLVLLFSVLMFIQYYREQKRIEKQNNPPDNK